MPPKDCAGSISKAKSKKNHYLRCSFIVSRSKLAAAYARVLPASVSELERTIDFLKPGTPTYVCNSEYTDVTQRNAPIHVASTFKILGTLISKKRKTPEPSRTSEHEGKPVCTAITFSACMCDTIHILKCTLHCLWKRSLEKSAHKSCPLNSP
jgi:hypothetical protein